MGNGTETSTAAVLDFETGRRRRDHRSTCDEVRQQLESLLSGERQAAAWLYDTFAPGLFRRLAQRYGHLEGLDANDLLHDSYLFFLQHDAKVLRDFVERVAPEQQTPDRLERHLWDLACGVASNRRRSAARRDYRPLEQVTGSKQLEDNSQEKLLLERDELDRLDRCLEGHGSRLYLYFQLRYADGYSPSEIAKITGWSQKATYKLRQSLNEAVRYCAELLGLP